MTFFLVTMKKLKANLQLGWFDELITEMQQTLKLKNKNVQYKLLFGRKKVSWRKLFFRREKSRFAGSRPRKTHFASTGTLPDWRQAVLLGAISLRFWRPVGDFWVVRMRVSTSVNWIQRCGHSGSSHFHCRCCVLCWIQLTARCQPRLETNRVLKAVVTSGTRAIKAGSHHRLTSE